MSVMRLVSMASEDALLLKVHNLRAMAIIALVVAISRSIALAIAGVAKETTPVHFSQGTLEVRVTMMVEVDCVTVVKTVPETVLLTVIGH